MGIEANYQQTTDCKVQRVRKTMKSNKTLNFFGSAAMAALAIHPWATAVHAGVAVSIGQNFTGSTDSLNASPDPCGGANEDYFVEFNIDNFTVYRKADGAVVL